MHAELMGRVMAHTGADEKEAHAAITAVLAALAQELGRLEADALADALPRTLSSALHAQRNVAGDSLPERVAFIERVSSGRAREHVGAVCTVLAELLPESLLSRLAHALAPGSAAWLAPPSPEADEPHLRPRRHTLAEGRPGSDRPLSESRPPAAQSDSVVIADNPHGDTKLSSSRGLTQEREHETLATTRRGGPR
jgi:uncharacterized protein (DUF2267 family)